MLCTAHFAQRVHERIGSVDPEILAENLDRAIREGRDDFVRYLGRQSKDGLRVFEFRVRDGRTFGAVVNTEESMTFITVIPAGWVRLANGRATLGEAA